MKNKCSSEIPNMPTGCAPDNRRPEKICGTCRYFNPEFPVNGKPAPVCLAIKEMKGGERNTATPWNATLFSLLKWEVRKRIRTIGIKAPETNAGFLPFICEREQTVGNAAKKP